MKKTTVVAVKGIVVRDGRILIVKRSMKEAFAPGGWEFAGGKIDFGEEPEDALRREVLEETGLEIEVGKILYVSAFMRSSERQNFVLTYLCAFRSGEVVLSEEHEDFLWVDRSRLTDYLFPMIREDLDRFDVWKYL